MSPLLDSASVLQAILEISARKVTYPASDLVCLSYTCCQVFIIIVPSFSAILTNSYFWTNSYFPPELFGQIPIPPLILWFLLDPLQAFCHRS